MVNGADKEIYLLTVSIRSIGIFSSAIQTILGQEQLHKFFCKLIDISDYKIIK